MVNWGHTGSVSVVVTGVMVVEGSDVGVSSVVGGSSGLPQAQRARGIPWSSMSNAVPAPMTASYPYAAPSLKPYMCTLMSWVTNTGVRARRYSARFSKSMP
ncbi:unannotated protein [freshwater metagenome]|uniref:Unannotated protein n=1 Tax=freshwater metagenome TaxID=449393 RepID=A0A6J6FW32_9ZZZZ